MYLVITILIFVLGVGSIVCAIYARLWHDTFREKTKRAHSFAIILLAIAVLFSRLSTLIDGKSRADKTEENIATEEKAKESFQEEAIDREKIAVLEEKQNSTEEKSQFAAPNPNVEVNEKDKATKVETNPVVDKFPLPKEGFIFMGEIYENNGLTLWKATVYPNKNEVNSRYNQVNPKFVFDGNGNTKRFLIYSSMEIYNGKIVIHNSTYIPIGNSITKQENGKILVWQFVRLE